MNQEFQEKIKKLVELLGLNEPSVDFDAENRKITIFANEGEWIKKHLPYLVADTERLANLLAKKHGLEENIFVDINNYRKERENLIVELAKAAARKVLLTRQEVKLPAMNAYERRLVHVELSARPDIKSESYGEGPDRCVVIRPML
jgi:predicted RNA-binding protein Jag